MQVSKWGNSLAVRLPAAVVEALDLKEGDSIDIEVSGARHFEIKKAPAPANCSLALENTVAACPRILSSTGRRPAKADWAEELLAGGGVVSVRVLDEFAAVAFRKLGMS